MDPIDLNGLIGIGPSENEVTEIVVLSDMLHDMYKYPLLELDDFLIRMFFKEKNGLVINLKLKEKISMEKLTDQNYQQKISQDNVLVDFGATWCGPCRAIAPILEELSTERNDITFVKVDIEEATQFTDEQNIICVPTLILFKDGKAIARKEGGTNKKGLISWLEESLNPKGA